ncbi:MAG: VanZ family protein [Alphaproteobacteria bacterium]|nr:VanZ family protein [Alphaproteobacteria bacterium]
MDMAEEKHQPAPRTGARVLAVHAFAVLLVFAFVNTFAIWRAFGEIFGQTARDALPWIAMFLLALVLAFAVLRRKSVAQASWFLLAGAIGLAAIGLSITDPAFPSKRIHVPQYFMLAVVVWVALPARLRTWTTPLFTLLAAALYGVHDEFLQGLHSRRTFGLRDMTVNLCGAASGTLVMLAFLRGTRVEAGVNSTGSFPVTAMVALAAAVAGAILMAWAATGFRNDLLPYWTALPVVVGGFWLMLEAERMPNPGDQYALRALAAICTAFLLYPVLTDVAHLDFA